MQLKVKQYELYVEVKVSFGKDTEDTPLIQTKFMLNYIQAS